MRKLGFTLLEVMVAVALMSIVVAGAMAAFIAQSRAVNTQQQTSSANDTARETIRLISNDVRSAAAGITPGAAGTGSLQGPAGASAPCDPGTVPFDINGAIACLPPVFRSNTPMFLPNGVGPGANVGGQFTKNCGDAEHPGYQLSFAGGITVPALPTGLGPGTALFCPDDLVVLGVDDTNPLFMVQNAPGVTSVQNSNGLLFAGTTTPSRKGPTGPVSPNGAGYGFDDGNPTQYLPLAGTVSGCLPFCEPMMLFGGATGAALMNAAYTSGPTPIPAANAGACVLADCGTNAYGIAPSTASFDLIRNNLTFGSIAVPAHLYRYSVEPVDASGNPSNCTATPCVSANLVRSLILPQAQNTVLPNAILEFSTVSSTVLLQGVVDMQVEFGIETPTPSVGAIAPGTLQYVNSGGFQSAVWAPGAGVPPGALASPNNIDNCLAGSQSDPGVWTGVCFPTGGSNGTNALTLLRTVRLNLTVRSGTNINTRLNQGTAAAIGAAPLLQPAVQDLSPAGNAEAKQWGFTTAGAFAPLPAVDGATYRQVTTEIYVRNLGWTTNL